MELPTTLDHESVPLPVPLAVLLGAATLLGVAHHVDHLVRGNHVGWPVTPAVNAFTFSLAIYPLVAVGVALYLSDRAHSGYLAGVMTLSALAVGVTHLGPWAIEPPSDIVGPHASPLAGYAALGLMLALLATVTVGAVYTTLAWLANETGNP